MDLHLGRKIALVTGPAKGMGIAIILAGRAMKRSRRLLRLCGLSALAAAIMSQPSALSVEMPLDTSQFCTGLTGETPESPSGGLKLGRIIGNTRAEFLRGELLVCDRSVTECSGRLHAFVAPGTLVAVGKKGPGFVCAYYSDGGAEMDGWLPSGQVQIENANRVVPSLSSWQGTWRAVANAATIHILPSNGTLHADGEAAWPSETDPNRNVGDFQATATPRGSTLALSEGPPDSACHVTLLLLGDVLAAVDNQLCGGMNVRFSGFYVRDGN
jgi:hypothetical protein